MFEDALSGVAAGAAGHFGAVIGVAHYGEERTIGAGEQCQLSIPHMVRPPHGPAFRADPATEAGPDGAALSVCRHYGR